MDGRRKSRRELKLQETIQKMRKEKPTISQQFADIKKELASLSKDDWENIPDDLPDYTVKKKKKERYTPIPDRIFEKGLMDGEMNNSIDPNEPVDGISTTNTNLNELGKAKSSVLSLVFDKVNSISKIFILDF